jgi:hypothetical protein
MTTSLLVASLLFVAFAWGPSAAHLLELPAKMALTREEYLIVQQLYRGWALLGIVIAGALVSSLAFAISSWGSRWSGYAWMAFLCVVGAQGVFWGFTFPMNQATGNWTTLPPDWEPLRAQWEYSHAVGAALNLAALVWLLLATIAMIGPRRVRARRHAD